MNILKPLVMACAGVLALLAQADGGYTVGSGGTIGLYDSTGNQLTSSVNLISVSYTLGYQNSFSAPGVSPSWTSYLSVGGVWKTTLVFRFSNSSWQTAPAGSVVGVQVCNYTTHYDHTTGLITTGPLLSSFSQPLTSPLVGNIDPLTGNISANVNYASVNPRLFYVSSLSVDSSDSSGKTGVLVYNSSSIAPAPWYLLPNVVTIYRWANGDLDNYFGGMWVFPRCGSNGVFGPEPVFGYPASNGA